MSLPTAPFYSFSVPPMISFAVKPGAALQALPSARLRSIVTTEKRQRSWGGRMKTESKLPRYNVIRMLSQISALVVLLVLCLFGHRTAAE